MPKVGDEERDDRQHRCTIRPLFFLPTLTSTRPHLQRIASVAKYKTTHMRCIFTYSPIGFTNVG